MLNGSTGTNALALSALLLVSACERSSYIRTSRTKDGGLQFEVCADRGCKEVRPVSRIAVGMLGPNDRYELMWEGDVSNCDPVSTWTYGVSECPPKGGSVSAQRTLPDRDLHLIVAGAHVFVPADPSSAPRCFFEPWTQTCWTESY